MNRTFSPLVPALLLALAILAATALATAAPYALWTAFAAPLLLALATLGIDAVQGRRSGRRSLFSTSALVAAAAVLVSCGIVAFADLRLLALMIPILGSCTVVPVIVLPKNARTTCRDRKEIPCSPV